MNGYSPLELTISIVLGVAVTERGSTIFTEAELGQIETPQHESFYFGLYTCAFCLDANSIPKKQRKTAVLKKPQYGAVMEILIPAGRHAFHKECLMRLYD